jgi:hypothetical protein
MQQSDFAGDTPPHTQKSKKAPQKMLFFINGALSKALIGLKVIAIIV